MERHTCRPDVSPLKQMIMKRVKHLLLASCLLPTFLGAQGVASASFLEITPDAQSAGMAGTGLAITDNGSTAIFHNASTIAFSQDVMGASYSYADINKDFGMHSASLFYRIGREGKHGFSVGFRHYKDADFHWQDGAEDHARAWNVEAAYFRNVAKNLSLSLTLRYLQVALDFNYLLPSEYRHLQAGIGAEYNFLKYGIIRGGYHFGDNDKGTGNYGTLGCGINFWPIRADFSYALADKDCFMHKTWQLGIGIVF